MDDTKVREYIAIEALDIVGAIRSLNKINSEVNDEDKIFFRKVCIIGGDVLYRTLGQYCLVEVSYGISDNMMTRLEEIDFEIITLHYFSESDTQILINIVESNSEWYDINDYIISNLISKALVYDVLGKDSVLSMDNVIVREDIQRSVEYGNDLHIKIIDILHIEEKSLLKIIVYKDNLPISLKLVIDTKGFIIGEVMESVEGILNNMVESINNICEDRVSLLNMMKDKSIFDIQLYIDNNTN